MGVWQIGVRVSASSGSAKNVHRRSFYLLRSYHLRNLQSVCTLLLEVFDNCEERNLWPEVI